MYTTAVYTIVVYTIAVYVIFVYTIVVYTIAVNTIYTCVLTIITKSQNLKTGKMVILRHYKLELDQQLSR